MCVCIHSIYLPNSSKLHANIIFKQIGYTYTHNTRVCMYINIYVSDAFPQTKKIRLYIRSYMLQAFGNILTWTFLHQISQVLKLRLTQTIITLVINSFQNADATRYMCVYIYVSTYIYLKNNVSFFLSFFFLFESGIIKFSFKQKNKVLGITVFIKLGMPNNQKLFYKDLISN